MRCEEVRPLLPEYSAGELSDPGGMEVHLASCSSCSGELARYRELASAILAMGEATEDPSADLAERILAAVPPHRLRDDIRRLATDHPRAQVAAVSLGGAVLGATAIAIIWWRAARRTLATEGGLADAQAPRAAA